MIPAPGFRSRFWRGCLSRPILASDLKVASPVATLLGAWCYSVSIGTG